MPARSPTLDFMPSPVADKPGLVIRDPFHYSDATLIIPPALVACLEFFDGEHSELDLREYLVRITGDLDVGGLMQHLRARAEHRRDSSKMKLSSGRKERSGEGVRRSARARGGARRLEDIRPMPCDAEETFAGYLQGRPGARDGRVLAIAAPHVSPFGGVEAYRAAYSALSPADADRTFVILGTSHYGQPDRLGLTRKPFVTPFGETITDTALVDELAAAAGDGALMEDYCHAVEHSIEFQVVFLQHLFGPRIRIVPILCGSYARSLYQGGLPEDDEQRPPHARRAWAKSPPAKATGCCGFWESTWLTWAGATATPSNASAGQDEMEEVARARPRPHRAHGAGDARGFWDLVQENRDDLKWCGSAPIYTFLKAVPGSAQGSLLHYQQWNIDEQSVVSFAGMAFHSS